MFLLITMGEICCNNTFKINIYFTFLHSHEHCLHWRLSEMILIIVAMDEIVRNKEFKIGGGDRRHKKELIYFRHFNGNIIIFLSITMGE